MWHGRTLAVVLPTYNEAGSIAECIRGFESLGIVDDLVVVNNNAHPDTSPAVAGTGAREVHESVQGYGAAIQRGLRETSSADLVCICEPDGTFDPADLLKLLPFTVDVEVVFGSRTVQTFILHGANMGAFLRWGNWAVAKLAMVLFNSVHLSDVGCTFRVLSPRRDRPTPAGVPPRRQRLRLRDDAPRVEPGRALHPGAGEVPAANRRQLRHRRSDEGVQARGVDDPARPARTAAGEMSTSERATVRRILVDARPISHPTAGGRGVGNHVAGLLEGLAGGETPVTALVGSDRERDVLDPTVTSRIDVEVLGRSAIRRAAAPGTWYLATSLFLHPISLDPIPASVTEARLPIAALLYDVIPYRYPEQYLTEDDPHRQARLRAVLSRTVDVFCSNSEFVSRTAVDALGLDPARLHVTGCGVAARFRPGDRVAARSLARPYFAGAHQSIVAAITGADDRKNTGGLLRAWARLPAATRMSRTLVVIAGASDDVLRSWIRSAGELGITGEVRFATDADDEQVVAMLQAAELVVVPSLEEGFGLPVLEGAACGAPVVCSGVSSLPEVLPEPRAHFDPHDASDMALVIDRALTDQTLRATLRSAAASALERWTWQRVAGDVVATIASTSTGRRTRSPRRRYAVLAEDLAGASPIVAEIRARAPDADVTVGLDPIDPTDRESHSSMARSWRPRSVGTSSRTTSTASWRSSTRTPRRCRWRRSAPADVVQEGDVLVEIVPQGLSACPERPTALFSRGCPRPPAPSRRAREGCRWPITGAAP